MIEVVDVYVDVVFGFVMYVSGSGIELCIYKGFLIGVFIYSKEFEICVLIDIVFVFVLIVEYIVVGVKDGFVLVLILFI